MLALVWMYTRPYEGIVHDAILYSFQAIAIRDPARFSDDLYVRFGSQAEFSVYTEFLALVIDLMGLRTANLILTLAGQTAWMIGAVLLVRAVFEGNVLRIVGFGAILLLPSAYGGVDIFRYAEPFHTPRIFAEGAALAGIAMALTSGWRRSVAMLVLSAIVHPLMALPAAGTVFLLAAERNRRLWLLPAVAALVFAALAFGGVHPFDRVGRAIEGEWWRVVVRRCNFALITQWDLPDYMRILVQANIAGLVYSQGSDLMRRLLRALAMAVAIALLASLVAADLSRNLLAVNLQLYRATWLLGVTVNMLAAVLVVGALGRRNALAIPLLAGLALYALDHFFPLMSVLAAPQLALTSAAMWLAHRRSVLPRPCATVLTAVTCIAALCALVLMHQQLNRVIAVQHPSLLWTYQLLALSLVAATAFFAGHPRSATALATGALALGVATYDHESPWQRLATSEHRPPQAVLSVIENARNVYWEGGFDYSWFGLRRPSYFSCVQGTGSMFYEATALEYLRRGRALSSLNTVDFSSTGSGHCLPRQRPGVHSGIDRDTLRRACLALPELDLIALLNDVPGAPSLSWKLPFTLPVYQTIAGRATRTDHDRFHFFRCADLRALVTTRED